MSRAVQHTAQLGGVRLQIPVPQSILGTIHVIISHLIRTVSQNFAQNYVTILYSSSVLPIICWRHWVKYLLTVHVWTVYASELVTNLLQTRHVFYLLFFFLYFCYVIYRIKCLKMKYARLDLVFAKTRWRLLRSRHKSHFTFYGGHLGLWDDFTNPICPECLCKKCQNKIKVAHFAWITRRPPNLQIRHATRTHLFTFKTYTLFEMCRGASWSGFTLFLLKRKNRTIYGRYKTFWGINSRCSECV